MAAPEPEGGLARRGGRPRSPAAGCCPGPPAPCCPPALLRPCPRLGWALPACQASLGLGSLRGWPSLSEAHTVPGWEFSCLCLFKAPFGHRSVAFCPGVDTVPVSSTALGLEMASEEEI